MPTERYSARCFKFADDPADQHRSPSAGSHSLRCSQMLLTEPGAAPTLAASVSLTGAGLPPAVRCPVVPFAGGGALVVVRSAGQCQPGRSGVRWDPDLSPRDVSPSALYVNTRTAESRYDPSVQRGIMAIDVGEMSDSCRRDVGQLSERRRRGVGEVLVL